jgi:hypothetical protein
VVQLAAIRLALDHWPRLAGWRPLLVELARRLATAPGRNHDSKTEFHSSDHSHLKRGVVEWNALRSAATFTVDLRRANLSNAYLRDLAARFEIVVPDDATATVIPRNIGR